MCQRIHCITVALITVALMLALLWPHETTAKFPRINTVDCDSTLLDLRDSGDYSIAPMGADGTPDVDKSLSADLLSAEFQFMCLTDSFVVRSMFTEFSSNGEQLRLAHWCYDRCVCVGADTQYACNWTLRDLHDRSTTRPFMVRLGDTLRFFRSIYWYDRFTDELESRRFSRDATWSYSVDLVDVQSGQNIQQLDTMSIRHLGETDHACRYSWFPAASIVSRVVDHSVIPDGLTPRQTCIRVRVYLDGEDAHSIHRCDQVGFLQSSSTLKSIGWADYSERVAELEACYNSVECGMDVRSVDSKAISVAVGLGNSPSGHISIADVFGSVVYTTSVVPSEEAIQVSLSSGFYILTYHSGGAVLCTKKVYVE